MLRDLLGQVGSVELTPVIRTDAQPLLFGALTWAMTRSPCLP